MIHAETDRLILRSWTQDDLPLFKAMNKDPRVMKYFPALLTDADFHNQGYATEAAKKVLELAKSSGINRIYSFTATVNKPSERVMQKISMTRIGEFAHPKLTADSPLLMHTLYTIPL